MRGLARRRGRPIGFRLLDAVPLVRRLQLRQARLRHLLARPCVRQPLVERFDRLIQRGACAGDLHLLPAAQVLAQLTVAPGLGRLPLERVPLAVELEDDVVDAREILAGRFDLQFGGAAAALELRYARRFLQELPPLHRARPQHLTDLALLDDRVRLDAHARVHQQVLDVAQPAHPAVDQVLALTGSEQPPADFYVPNEIRTVLRRVTVAVGPVDLLAVAVLRRKGGDLAEPQPDLRRGGRAAPVAAAEDDVLHPVAAQAPHALLAQHPGDGVDEVALAAAVRTDDGGHTGVERNLGLLRKALESRDSQLVQAHPLLPAPMSGTQKDRSDRGTARCACRAAGNALTRSEFDLRSECSRVAVEAASREWGLVSAWRRPRDAPRPQAAGPPRRTTNGRAGSAGRR